MKNQIRFYLVCILFFCTLSTLDRFFFKGNHHFSPYFLFSTLKPDPKWDTSIHTSIDPILQQPFYYLGKGNRCFAFISADQHYVIKFHRFPTHLRLFFAISHPLANIRTKWKEIQTLDNQKLLYNFQSYMDSLRYLKEETGLIHLHINPTHSLPHTITVIDSSQSSYRIPLDQTCFIIQHKAELLYPKLDRLILEGKIIEAQQVISHMLHLIVTTCKKGFVHKDLVLHQNLGLLTDRAIYIDIGDLVYTAGMENKEQYIPYLKAATQGLRAYLIHTPDLLTYYDREIHELEKTNF